VPFGGIIHGSNPCGAATTNNSVEAVKYSL
jgi:hypothetical protein